MKKSIYLALCATTLSNAQVPALLPVEKRTFSQSQFIPNISLIVDASYANRNVNDNEFTALGTPGIIEGAHGSDDGHGHSHGAYSPNNGFNFNYAELILSANVDPNFSLDAVFHLQESDFEIEEAYFTNATLLDGLRIRGGKFLSDFGRLNNQHQHFWDFNEAPLIYQGFLGAEHLNEVGLQTQYTLPIDTYVMLGAEVFQGINEQSFGYEGFELSNGIEIETANAPSLFVGYVKTSFDLGDTTIMPGLSYVYGDSKKLDNHEGHEIAFDGTSSLMNAELTVKHYFDSYSFISFQSEWMRLEKKGDEYHVEPGHPTEKEQQKITQEGLYAQLIYGMNTNIRFGLRYENIYKNDYAFTEEALPTDSYTKYTAMAEYHFSEFSRLRLEYIRNNALYLETSNGFESQNLDTLLLSINLSIGAHGAHSF